MNFFDRLIISTQLGEKWRRGLVGQGNCACLEQLHQAGARPPLSPYRPTVGHLAITRRMLFRSPSHVLTAIPIYFAPQHCLIRHLRAPPPRFSQQLSKVLPNTLALTLANIIYSIVHTITLVGDIVKCPHFLQSLPCSCCPIGDWNFDNLNFGD